MISKFIDVIRGESVRIPSKAKGRAKEGELVDAFKLKAEGAWAATRVIQGTYHVTAENVLSSRHSPPLLADPLALRRAVLQPAWLEKCLLRMLLCRKVRILRPE